MVDYSESKFDALRKKYEFLLIVLMAFVACLVYAKTLTGDFIFDDEPNNELPRSRAARYQNEFLSYFTPMQSIEEFF